MKKDNRQLLEEVALRSVQRSGLKNLSFRTLAEEIGVKSSSVHYYFPEKSDLARTLIERYSNDFFSSLHEIGSQKSGLRKKLAAFVGIFEEVAREDKFCFCGMMAAEIEQLSDDNQKLLAEYFTQAEQWLTDQFDEHETELATNLSSGTLAKCVLSGLEGALLLDRVVGDGQMLKAQKLLTLSLLE